MSKLRKEEKIKYWLLALFLLSSGAKVWVGILTPAVASLFFLIVSFLYHRKVHHGRICYNKGFEFLIFSVIWSIISFVVNGTQLQDNSMFGYAVFLLGAFFFISSFDFTDFRNKLLDIVCALCLIGVPVFILNEFEYLQGTIYYNFPDSQYKLFGPFTLGWPNDFHRFAGIWHEAGACQIVLNSTLWLFCDNIIKWSWEKGQLKKIIIVVIGTLATLSTGGYMCLMLLVCAYVVNLKISGTKKFVLYPVVLLLSTVLLYVMYYSPIIQEKLFADEDHISLVRRSADILAFWDMAQTNPMLGYGLGTKEFWDVSTKLGNTANSSGIMTYLASLGFPWLIMYLTYTWKGIGRFLSGKERFFLLLAVILMQFNEKFIEYPITNMFIFTFLSYTGVYARKY